MRKHYKLLVGGLFLFFLFLAVGCTNNKLSDKTTKVEGKGTSYTFRLPSSWAKQDDVQRIYGSQAVYGAEDKNSNSNMAVVIVAKDDIEVEGFGERTRTELAAQNGYSNEKDVYFVKEKINDNEVYKYSFETTFGDKKVWAHYYSIFSEHAVIQFLYYSAQDSSYEDRVKIIDESIGTVKEVDYSKEKAEEELKATKSDEISFSTDAYDVNIIGLGTLKDQDNNQLVALRFTYTNKSAEAQIANNWAKDISLKQAGEALTEAFLTEDNLNYEIVRLQAEGNSSVAKGETKEGVLLYKVNGKATLTLSLADGLQSEEMNYQLQLPEKSE